MRRHTFLPLAVVCGVLASAVLIAQPPPLVPFRGLIDHVSVDQWGGVPQDNVEIWHRAISGDGRYVVMHSRNPYLATGDYDDYNGNDDIFLRDRTTGTTTRISRSFDGGSGDGISQYGTISTNGRHVAFASGSTNLVPGDTNDHWDVFVRDLDQQQTVRVSVATDGTQGDRDAYYPSISANGRFVAFLSWATTFAPGVSSSSPQQIYLHDRDADADGVFDEPGGVTTELVSAGFTGGIADASVNTPRVTDDGRYVLFESAATNLSDVGNPNGSNHLYRRDMVTTQTAFIDRAVTGGPSAWGIGSGTSDMTGDGRYITFSSISPDIVFFDMNWQSQVFLYDTAAGPLGMTIVSRLPDGTLGDASSYASSVSADGRYVLFTTAASNLASPPPGATGPAMLAVRDMLDGSFARVDVLDSGDPFDEADYYYTPAISADGTAIVLQTRSQGAVDWAFSFGASHVVVMTALTATPESASYPMAGGYGSIEVNTTAVSGWRAWSYEPWIVVMEGGDYGAGPRTVQYWVSSNDAGIVRNGSIRIGTKVIPIHQEGDGDTTPPILVPTVTGTQVNGWYTSDITVTWSITDPESEIVSQYGCYTHTYTTDFLDAQPFCEATSHGGTSYERFSLRRDTTGPTITIGVPAASVYAPGSVVTPEFGCGDPYSGTATCTITQGSSPIDTTQGWHTFTVTATDNAGNVSTKSVNYLVGTGQCVVPNDSLRAHWTFENTLLDASEQNYADPTPYFNPVFVPGVAGKAWQAQPQTNSYLTVYDGNRTYQGDGYTVAVWLKPAGALGQSGTIISRAPQYRIARYPDGTLRWAFNHTTGFNWVNTGIVVPTTAWTHVAVTYDFGLVKTYINGQLAHTHQLTGTRVDSATDNPTIGGRPDVTASYFGWMDELEVYQAALSAAEVDLLVRAGSGSSCLPEHPTVSVSVPPTVPFGPTYPATATLLDESGAPMADRWISFISLVGPGPGASAFGSCVTDNNGQCTATLTIPATAEPRTYSYGVKARFDGDAHYVQAEAVADVTLVRLTPTVTWSPPADIVYGTALSGTQLNATANVPGTFSYSPATGAVLNAGSHTLSVTFTPTDTTHWAEATETTTIVVNQAASTISWSNPGNIVHGTALSGTQLNATANVPGTFSYSPAAGAVLNANSHTLSVTFTPDDAVNYTGASANVSLTVTRATPTITWSNPVDIVYGTALSGAQLNATANVPGSFSYAPAAGAVLNAGSQTLTVTFTPDDASNYNAASANVSLTVTKAASTISWSNPAGIVYGTALSATQLNATANVPGTFAYSPASGTVLGAGPQGLSVTFTPADAANYESSSAAVSIAIAPAALTVQTNNATKVYGEALPAFTTSGTGFVNGDSMASLSGTLTFSTAATATSAPGVYPVTPGGVSSANYTITFAAGTLTVGKASTSLTFTTTPNPSNHNQAVQLRAVVSAVAPGAGVATGTVEFRRNGTLLGTATLVGGVATLNKSFKKGTHTLTATYAGNANFNGSSGSVTHQAQ